MKLRHCYIIAAMDTPYTSACLTQLLLGLLFCFVQLHHYHGRF